MQTKRKQGTAEIISIGDELLIGQVINTNASWMGEQLFLNGIDLQQVTTIGDQPEHLHQAIRSALERVQFIFLTGGLGPTSDDLTKPALCSFFDVPLVFHPDAYDQVQALFARRGMAVTERNKQQAMLPVNCKAVANHNGTAPGMWFDVEDAVIVSMPGVPFEMRPMFAEQVIPELKKRFATSHYLFKTVMTTGVGESMLADRIQHWETALPSHFKIAYLPQPGIVRLRVGAQGDDAIVLQNELNEQVQTMCALIPEYVYGFDNQLLEQVVGTQLSVNGWSVATAESCTGGYLAHLLTSVVGSSAYFKGSVVAYANEIKVKMLQVQEASLQQYGAVSEAVAKEMAMGLRHQFDTDFAVSTTGIAGPDGGSAEKPVGTVWIALATRTGCQAQRFQLGEHRDRNIRRATLAALNLLRIEMQSRPKK